MNKYAKFIIPVVTLLVGLGGGVFAGIKYQQSKIPSFTRRNGFMTGNANMMNRGRAITGEIISQDDKSITVKMSDGSTKIVFLAGNTTYEKSDTASVGDLKTGTKVLVFGNTNSDGSVTAQNVQINPVIRMGN